MTSVAKTPPRTSGSPKRKKLRKDEIVAEATRLFAERGYEGASMGDLAERVGLRKASLFHHFPSKDALYTTVLMRLLEGVQGAVLAAATGEGSFMQRLDALSDALTMTLGGDPYAARLLVREVMDWGPLVRGELGEAIDTVLKAALEFAREGQREGVFNADLDPTHVIISLIGIHFMPFAIGQLMERFTGTTPFHPSFLEARKIAVRNQVRLVISARS